ncbi:hypothetical protein DL95DRAFT_416523 [Leptodontidium sp. 2 PMI_412]|nr:hypothetical protein DL95DRAFT_416523 [Leptodontidium sp. 2 PMI_412]
MATWSVWEPETVRDDEGEDVFIAKMTVDNEVFRTPTGSLPTSPPNHALQIPLHAFAPSSCYPSNVPLTGSIAILAQTLCKFLVDVERTASMIGKKRRREITPTEELLERDEKRWNREEDKVGEREIEDDASFKGSVESDRS